MSFASVRPTWFAAVIVMTALSGCAAMRGYPERSNDLESDLTALRPYFDPKTIQAGGESRKWRDEVVNSQIRAIDLQFTTFSQELVKESVGLNTVVDLTVIGLGAATGVIDGETTKSVLGVLSGGITGMKGVIDKDVFYSKTMPVLLAQMEAQRKVQLAKIRTGLSLDTRRYPLSAAQVDIEEYYKAGSIPGALQAIIEESGEEGAAADREMKALLVKASRADVANITEIRQRFNALYAAWNAAPRSPEGSAAAETAAAILEQVQANHGMDGKPVFDALDARIRAARPGSPELAELGAAFAEE